MESERLMAWPHLPLPEVLKGLVIKAGIVIRQLNIVDFGGCQFYIAYRRGSSNRNPSLFS
jgi:hypothetical protein